MTKQGILRIIPRTEAQDQEFPDIYYVVIRKRLKNQQFNCSPDSATFTVHLFFNGFLKTENQKYFF